MNKKTNLNDFFKPNRPFSSKNTYFRLHSFRSDHRFLSWTINILDKNSCTRPKLLISGPIFLLFQRKIYNFAQYFITGHNFNCSLF